jgi:maleylacetate reductase
MAGSTILRTGTERFVLGTAASEALLAEAERRAAARVFVIAGASLRRQTSEIASIERALAHRHAATFSGIGSHTPMKDVVSAVLAAREARADLIVTVGGGSVTDAGKDVALGLKADVRSLADIPRLVDLYRWGNGEARPETAPEIAVICVPTTLSGGEVNHVGGGIDEALGKFGLEHRDNAPAAIIYDPKITRHTPDWLWFSTGIRAVDHAVESLASLESNEYCDVVAEGALRLLADGLMRCKQNPGDMNARLRCQVGAWQSMIPIVAGVPMGASHAIGHGLGSIAHITHGHTSCVMLPAVQRWNAGSIPERQLRISRALGDPQTPADMLLDRLIRSLGQPRSLAEVGVRMDDDGLRRVAEYVLASHWGKSNPRPLQSPADVIEILNTVLYNPGPV